MNDDRPDPSLVVVSGADAERVGRDARALVDSGARVLAFVTDGSDGSEESGTVPGALADAVAELRR